MGRGFAVVFAIAVQFSGAFAGTALAAQWTRLSTPDFELYASSGEKTGREILNNFEEVHGFFLRASPVREGTDDPVRLVEFNSDRLIAPYRVNDYSPAWFLGAPDRDYIVIDNAVKFEMRVAIHEYMHLIVRRSGLKLPVWVNEGWAEVYSTLRPVDKSVAVGDLIDGRMQELASNKWLTFDQLTTVDHRSPVYNEATRAGIFYAESWALVHMLYLAPEYQENFGKFILALNQGKSAAEAVRIAWDRSPDQVFADLRTYFDRRKIFGRVFDAPLPQRVAAPAVSTVGEFDAALMLADLSAASGKAADAKLAYQKLLAGEPDNADLARSMGYLALEQHNPEAARGYFGKAFDRGERDATMCLRLASLDQGKVPPARIIGELQRAVELRPDLPDAKIELGLEEVEGRRFEEGIQQLVGLRTITAARAAPVYCALTYARIETGDLSGARSNLETCRKYANSDKQTASVRELSRLIEGRLRPSAAVHPNEQIRAVKAVAVKLDCSRDGNRLQVLIGGKPIYFDLPEPDAVELTAHSGSSFDFTCGSLKPFDVLLEYAPPRTAIETSAGVIRRMEF